MKAKADAKAARAAGAADRAEKRQAGLTNALKKAIKSDVLLCTKCKATKLGPSSNCTCKGGASKPDDEYDDTIDLVNAAKARHQIILDEQKKAANAQQADVAAERERKKASLEDLENGTSESYLDASKLAALKLAEEKKQEEKKKNPSKDHTTTKRVAFQAGKLGLVIEGNVVNKAPVPKTQAKKLGILEGWVVHKVNGIQCPTDKPGILEIVKKENVEGGKDLTFEFRVPDANCFNCAICNICQPKDYFMANQITDEDKGQGKQECLFCHPDPGMDSFSLY